VPFWVNDVEVRRATIVVRRVLAAVAGGHLDAIPGRQVVCRCADDLWNAWVDARVDSTGKPAAACRSGWGGSSRGDRGFGLTTAVRERALAARHLPAPPSLETLVRLPSVHSWIRIAADV